MAFTPNGTPIKYGIDGHSDLVAYKNGRAFFIEIKVLPDKQRDTQKKFQQAVEKFGCIYTIITNKDNIDDRIKGLSEKRNRAVKTEDNTR
jgi:hypothetical protein